MQIRGGAPVCFFLYLLFVVSFWNADGKTVEVVGIGECADCAENNFETSQAFSGLRVNIDCKPEDGKYFKTRGSGEVDKHGNFKVSLPDDMVKDGELKEECYAQLHSVSAAPCPAHDGVESTKIVLKSSSDEKHNLGLKGRLRFSPVTCASASFWPHFKFPPLPKWHHPPLPKWNHPPLPTFPLPPLNGFPHHHPIFPPIYKKPLPPPVPVYKPPPVPVYEKPLPPPVPVYKPPPVPVYKKPLPPPVPYTKNHFLHLFQSTRSHFLHQFQYIKSHFLPQFQYTRSHFLHQFQSISLRQFQYTRSHFLHQFQSINLLQFQSTRNHFLRQFQYIRSHFLHQFRCTRSDFLLQFQSTSLHQFRCIRSHFLLQFQSTSLRQFRCIRSHFLLQFQSTSLLQFPYIRNHCLHPFRCTNLLYTNHLRLQSIRNRFHHLFLYTSQNPSLPFLTSHSLHFPRSLHSLRSHALPFLTFLPFPRFLQRISPTLPYQSFLLSRRFLPSTSTTTQSSENGLHCHPFLPIILKLL
ncbi:uncharacterized protein LOC120134180 isoform X13 [Hibiscus syriacus]|uniref:uncharacterized protein LOC120134180 isoform X13 n=1 Tax=Hibiscus syriacus TaxID=106335 RepID=UPI001923FE01|nr:uncharacterized protein LOC120134180 isoform X13 [Hibiscus syriacus]